MGCENNTGGRTSVIHIMCEVPMIEECEATVMWAVVGAIEAVGGSVVMVGEGGDEICRSL